MKESVLEFYDQRFTLGDMGGLDNLKDWLEKRRRAFSKEAKAFGLERPRGFLAMGVSGCGKSLAAKITASLWNLPLFRLDMNLVYSGMAGSPELVFSRALKTMDSVAPAILWIDEIESGISDKQGEGAASRILGYFLTWMQEHTSEILSPPRQTVSISCPRNYYGAVVSTRFFSSTCPPVSNAKKFLRFT
jgi:vesicle-fusing ATPase